MAPCRSRTPSLSLYATALMILMMYLALLMIRAHVKNAQSRFPSLPCQPCAELRNLKFSAPALLSQPPSHSHPLPFPTPLQLPSSLPPPTLPPLPSPHPVPADTAAAPRGPATPLSASSSGLLSDPDLTPGLVASRPPAGPPQEAAASQALGCPASPVAPAPPSSACNSLPYLYISVCWPTVPGTVKLGCAKDIFIPPSLVAVISVRNPCNASSL